MSILIAPTLFSDDLPFILPKGEGYNWHFDESQQVFIVHLPQGELRYAAHFFDKKTSDDMLDYLLKNDTTDWKSTDWKSINPNEIAWKNIDWRLDSIRMFGKLIPQPRFTAWYGDEGKSYQYSGLKMQPKPWNEGLLSLKNTIEPIAGVAFNSVLLNWYRDGQDHMSWHADDERELGKNPTIGSVNFGASRRFLLRRKDNPSEKIEIPLHHGSLLLMCGEMQHFWQHALPKAAKVKDTRVNLTFRVIQ
jgi:alkylated DNA repair dioxygenase AlkB